MDKAEDQPLGASEFAATLNGDNPQSILVALRRFVKTVRRERRLALAEDADGETPEDDEEDSDDEMEENEDPDDDTNEPLAKKLKKSEEWKADTNSYHVPFVGTAVARGEVAPVEHGQWPTGLLDAYLKKSPLAIEMIGEDWVPSADSQIHKPLIRKKQGKLSRAIYKSHLKALTELVSAAIPMIKLKRKTGLSTDDDDGDDTTSESQTVFLTGLLKKRLAGFFHLLVSETDKGRGKPGIYGGCGSLAPVALKLIQNISLTSTTNARLVCRYLDEELSDGVLRVLLRPPPPIKETVAKKSPNDILTKSARVEAIQLATTLLQTMDSAVATYICTSGNRELKVKPGILYGALREGMAKHPQATNIETIDEDYLDSVSDMLECLRELLRNPRKSRVVNRRLLFDLFSRDPLQNLGALYDHAPSVATESLTDDFFLGKAARNQDVESNEDALQNAGSEARQLLFLLLVDKESSPLLADLSSRLHMQAVVKTILGIWQKPGSNVVRRRFIQRSIQSTPIFLQNIFRVLSIPEPKTGSEFLSTLSFVSYLAKNSPLPLDCLPVHKSSYEQLDPNEVLLMIIPAKLRRQLVGKAIQGTNSLVVLECLKVLRVTLERYRELETVLVSRGVANSFVRLLRSRFGSYLPDIQVILSIRTKFDPFTRNKVASLVYHAVCLLLQTYAEVLPEQVSSSPFEWPKLVPEFSLLKKAIPLVQRVVLSSVLRCLETSKKTTQYSSGSKRTLIEIMLRTTDERVYELSRSVTLHLVTPLIRSRHSDPENLAYIEIEIGWWLDSLSLGSADAFCQALDYLNEKSLVALGSVGSAIMNAGNAACLHLSTLAMVSLSVSNTENSEFDKMVLQVITRCLFIQRNPQTVARFIKSVSESEAGVLKTIEGKVLASYADALVNFTKYTATIRGKLLNDLVNSCFTEKHILSGAFVGGDLNTLGVPATLRDAIESCRFAIHTKLAREVDDYQKPMTGVRIRHIVPHLYMIQREEVGDRLLSCLVEDILTTQQSSASNKRLHLEVLLSSCPYQDASPKSPTKLQQLVSQLHPTALEDESTRCAFLGLALEGKPSSLNDLVAVQVQLLAVSHPTASSGPMQLLFNILEGVESTQVNLDYSTVEATVNAWLSVTQQNSSTPNEISALWLQDHFFSLLDKILRQNCWHSSLIIAKLRATGTHEVFNRCMARVVVKTEGSCAIAFLLSILKADPIFFDERLFHYLDSLDFFESQSWSFGLFDAVFEKLISNLPNRENLPQIVQHAVVERLYREVESYKQGHIDCDAFSSLFQLFAQTLERGEPSIDLVKLRRSLTESLKLAATQKRLLTEETFKILYKITTAVLDDNKFVTDGLSSMLFTCLLQLLPVTYKLTSVSTDGGTLGSSTILSWLIGALQHQNEPKSQISLDANPNVIMRCVRSALKFGVCESTKENHLAALSLRFVRVLLQHFHDQTDAIHRSVTPPPEEVFGMITSHSKFKPTLLRSPDQGNDEDRVELVMLLTLCVRLAVVVPIDPSFWVQLLSSFNAGLSSLDVAIRGFIDVVSVGKPQIETPYLDEMRWRGSIDSPAPVGRRWDWFFDALDSTRIRETVAVFPRFDSIDIKEEHGSKLGVEGMVTDDDSSDNDSEEGNAIEQLGTAMKHVDAQGQDIRYSPAYVLQLALGALDSCHTSPQDVEAQEDSFDDAGPESSDRGQKRNALVMMSRKLYEKGFVALCLASLSSQCLRVREMAVAILGLVLQACTSPEARAMSSWRDRPQVSMLLNSVQRALLIKYAESNFEVPVLPTLVASFLARASFSIAKPDDALYVPLNRFFLKSEQDHGAFQDMSRLPAFISLFCSPNDDRLQARKERLWALYLVKGGFNDGSSYRLVSSCHAPEMLMTSFETLWLSELPEEMKVVEETLLIDVLTTFLDNGGYKAGSHLINRIGLMSWIRSICTRQPIPQSFPRCKTRIALLTLIRAAASSILRNEKLMSAAVAEEICGLGKCVVELTIPTDMSSSEIAASLETGVRCLKTLCSVYTRAVGEREEESSFQHSSAIPLSRAETLLRVVSESHLSDTVLALCSLPVRVDTEECSHGSIAFCRCLLELLRSHGETCAIEILPCSLRRVAALAKSFSKQADGEDLEKIIELLLSLRPLFAKVGTYDLWKDTIALTLPGLTPRQTGILETARLVVEKKSI